jgi:brefeldin A-resistance guanine nucleotide exchange factor 1
MSNDAQSADVPVSSQTIDSSTSSINPTASSTLPILPMEAETNGFTMSYSRNTPVSVAVDPVALITTECITVTSAMRKHARWAHSSVSAILGGGSAPSAPNTRPNTPRDDLAAVKGKGRRIGSGFEEGDDDGGLANRWGLRGKKGKSMQDNPLMAGFGRLRRELGGCKGMVTFSNFRREDMRMLMGLGKQIFISSIRRLYFILSCRSYRPRRLLPLLPPWLLWLLRSSSLIT